VGIFPAGCPIGAQRPLDGGCPDCRGALGRPANLATLRLLLACAQSACMGPVLCATAVHWSLKLKQLLRNAGTKPSLSTITLLHVEVSADHLGDAAPNRIAAQTCVPTAAVERRRTAPYQHHADG
jgi:hypothetical protein